MDNITKYVDIKGTTVFKIVAILVGCWMLFLLRDIILIVITAIVIASAIEPLTLWFGRHGLGRTFAVILTYLMLGILLFGFVYFFLPSLINDIQAIVANFPTYLDSLNAPAQTNIDGSVSGGLFSSIPSSIPLSEVLGSLRESAQQLASNALGFVGAVFGGILSFLLIVVLSFYLAVQEDGVTNFLRIITPFRYEDYVTSLWKRTQKKIGLWLQGQLILSVIIGLLSFAGLLILGVPNALTLAILAGAFELIPLFGPILAAIPAIALGFIDGGAQLALFVALLYLVIQQLENQLLVPLVIKKVVGLPAIVVIISLLVGGQLAGFLGILIAVPIAAGLMELLKDIERYKHDELKRHSDSFGREVKAENATRKNDPDISADAPPRNLA